MRIKRQRRKLRGKYSGTCLSCQAKWSKCWYIASIENQKEWQKRLNKNVTPHDDEVCFQCWDAKIRTSPKRKIHFKSELPSLGNVETINIMTTKRGERNKRRTLNADFTYHIETRTSTSTSSSASSSTSSSPSSTSSTSSKKNSHIENDDENTSYDDEEDLFMEEEEEEEEEETYEEGILFEEDAVILLSTAFRTIPIHINDMNINININGKTISNNSISCLPDIAKQIINSSSSSEDSVFDDLKAKKRGAYL